MSRRSLDHLASGGGHTLAEIRVRKSPKCRCPTDAGQLGGGLNGRAGSQMQDQSVITLASISAGHRATFFLLLRRGEAPAGTQIALLGCSTGERFHGNRRFRGRFWCLGWPSWHGRFVGRGWFGFGHRSGSFRGSVGWIQFAVRNSWSSCSASTSTLR